jgi:hypothetical protein
MTTRVFQELENPRLFFDAALLVGNTKSPFNFISGPNNWKKAGL